MSNTENHIDILKQKHAQLEDEIHHEAARPQPDDIRIKALKVEKLRIKEEINSLSNS